LFYDIPAENSILIGQYVHEHQLPTTGLVTMSIRLVSKGGEMFLVRLNFHNSRFVVVRLLKSFVRFLRVCVMCGEEWRWFLL